MPTEEEAATQYRRWLEDEKRKKGSGVRALPSSRTPHIPPGAGTLLSQHILGQARVAAAAVTGDQAHVPSSGLSSSSSSSATSKPKALKKSTSSSSSSGSLRDKEKKVKKGSKEKKDGTMKRKEKEKDDTMTKKKATGKAMLNTSMANTGEALRKGKKKDALFEVMTFTSADKNRLNNP
jgi:hypothetical protein